MIYATIELKAFSVLEKSIFKGFYHIWAWWQSWSLDGNHFSNLLFPYPRGEGGGGGGGGLQMNLSNIGSETPEEQSFETRNIFPIQKCIGKQTWPCRKNVKCQCVTIILAILVDLLSPMIYAKIQPQGILGSGEEYFIFFLPYMGMAAILVNERRYF